jgi:hypothetical protein
MDALVVRARAEGGVIDASSTGFPAHELLTHLVVQHGLLLHGTNDTELDVLLPRPAHDFGTHVEVVAAADDGIWPLFYAVVARRRVEGVFTACMHLGRLPQLRRFYVFRVFGADPHEETTWTHGAVYAVQRAGFWREWGNEWLRGTAVITGVCERPLPCGGPHDRRSGADCRGRLVRFLSDQSDQPGPLETCRTRSTAATIPRQLSLTTSCPLRDRICKPEVAGTARRQSPEGNRRQQVRGSRAGQTRAERRREALPRPLG